jgi:hypothetical protein
MAAALLRTKRTDGTHRRIEPMLVTVLILGPWTNVNSPKPQLTWRDNLSADAWLAALVVSLDYEVTTFDRGLKLRLLELR